MATGQLGAVVARVQKGGGFEDDDFSIVHTIEFEGPPGTRTRFDTSSVTTDPNVGEKVAVIYLASQPSWVRLHDFNNMWGLPIGLLVFGAAVTPFAWIAKQLRGTRVTVPRR